MVCVVCVCVVCLCGVCVWCVCVFEMCMCVWCVCVRVVCLCNVCGVCAGGRSHDYALSSAHVTRVAPIIGSAIGIGRYWDISAVSVIGISIVLLTDYASMTS